MKFINLNAHDVKRELYKILRPKSYSFYQNLRNSDAASHTLKPFDRTKSIFFHIPKVAGISVSTGLYGTITGSHLPLSKYCLIYSYKEFEEYFKFTFVRNPWDRLYSAYSFLKQGGRNNEDQNFNIKTLQQFDNFEMFIDEWVNEENIWKYVHFYPQYHFITLPNNLKNILNFVGKYENLEEDYAYVSSKIIGSQALPKLNLTKSKTNIDYREMYSLKQKNKIEKIYEADIKLFGYDFDNKYLQRQIIV